MDPRCVERLTGRRFPNRPASLRGWARTTEDHGYPAIHPCAGSAVEGIVLDDIDGPSLRALDGYEDEGRLYVRRPVRAWVAGRSTPCQVYVPLACARELGDEPPPPAHRGPPRPRA